MIRSEPLRMKNFIDMRTYCRLLLLGGILAFAQSAPVNRPFWSILMDAGHSGAKLGYIINTGLLRRVLDVFLEHIMLHKRSSSFWPCVEFGP